jgi:hypothetical protein
LINQSSGLVDQDVQVNGNFNSNTGCISTTVADCQINLRDQETIILNKSQHDRLIRENTNLNLVKTRKNEKLTEYLIKINSVPKYYHHLNRLEEEEQSLWHSAMNDEINSMKKKQVFDIVARPLNTQILNCLWLFKNKLLPNGQLDKRKARLVILGNQQVNTKNQVHYSPVLNEISLKILLSIGVKRKLHIHQVDVQTAYLNSVLTDPVYVSEPDGFRTSPQNCWRLRKSVYGLRRASSDWYNHITKLLFELDFRRTLSDQCVFVNDDLIIGLYVDDLLVIGSDLQKIEKFKKTLSDSVEITDKGQINQFLGWEFEYNREKGELAFNMQSTVRNILEQFNLANANRKLVPLPTDTDFDASSNLLSDRSAYLSLMGSLIYVSKIYPELMFIINRLCSYMNKPTEHHFDLARRVLRYLIGVADRELVFRSNDNGQNVNLDIYSDANFNDSSSRSITGLAIILDGNLVHFKSKKQSLYPLQLLKPS